MVEIAETEAADLKAMLDAGEKVRLIDVRTAAEFNQGIIAGGEFIPLHTLPLRMNELAVGEDEKLVIYCRSGQRSGQACMYLKQHADIEAINLRGGIIRWYQSGHTVVPPPTAVT